jgi:pimeloyl-ACP methyl ester carboxylesterase
VNSKTQITPNGTHYQVVDYAENNDKSCLIFAHGVGLNHRIWQPQVDAFSDQHTVITYDLLGHGDSPTPSTDATMGDYIAQLEELRATLGIEKITVIGHSTGALISLGYGLAHPAHVNRLVPLNAIYCRPKEAQAAALSRVADARAHGPLKQLETTLIRWFGDGALSPELEAKKGTLRAMLKQANISGYATTYRLFVESDRLYEGLLQNIQHPTLFLTGELDPNSTPDMSVAMANEVPGASCAIISGSRHMTPYVDDAQTNIIIKEFLAFHV